MELRGQATRLIRGVGDLFPKQHVARAVAAADACVAPTPLSPSHEVTESSAKKRQLKAECRALRHQLLEKKASEEAFLNNMMVFFKDEDGKSIAQRMQIQDLVDQHEELQMWPRPEARSRDAPEALGATRLGGRSASCLSPAYGGDAWPRLPNGSRGPKVCRRREAAE